MELDSDLDPDLHYRYCSRTVCGFESLKLLSFNKEVPTGTYFSGTARFVPVPSLLYVQPETFCRHLWK